MELKDMILVSVDDHIIEPPDLFAKHLPKKWADRAPKLTYDAARKAQTWTWEYGASMTAFINAVVTLPSDEWGFDPSTLAELRPGCYDVAHRVRDMDANGILASMCFPSFPGMCGNYFAVAKDKDLGLACLRAYNDWHIDEWCASHPGRFIPLPVSPLWSPELAAEEVRRVARKGATAITFTEDAENLGYPSIHTGAWDPFFAACVDEGVVVAIHIASGLAGGFPGRDSEPLDVRYTMPTWNALPCAANFLWSKALQKFPDLKIALSEGGTSWIPGFLDRMERHYDKQRWTGADLGGLTPTETFQKHFLACFICDPSGLLLRDRIGIDNIAYEVDYPHSDCTFPGSPEELWEHFELAGATDEEIRKIGHENALRWLRFDAFSHVPKSEATVGVLRARAADVDLRVRSKKEYRKAWEAEHGAVR
ncbi:MAG: amidohydrolase [Deltaproteobacteria bacterium]|nr:amidohydrolase [Deltaproteobacteria bacterium]